MLNRINKFLQSLVIRTPQGDRELIEALSTTEEPSLDLAHAMLLVELALIDGNFDSREHEFILHVLQRDLKLGRTEAQNLVQSAQSSMSFRGTHGFAAELRNRLPIEGRQKLMDTLRQLMHVDESVDGFESYLERKYQDMLGL